MSTETLIRRARSQQLGDLLRRSAARSPTRTALVFREHRDTFDSLNETVSRAANALAERGIGRGDVVALLSHNNRAFVVLRFALARIGAVMAPFNFMLNASEIGFLLDNSTAVAMIAEESLVDTAEQAIIEAGAELRLKGVIPNDGSPALAGWESVEVWFDHENAAEYWVDLDDDDPVQLMYTSGTESRPKGTMLSSRSLYAQYATCIADGEMRGDDIELHCLPLYHCAQLDCFLTPDLYLGATSILMSAPDPAAMLETIEREKVSKLFCPPTVWISLLRHPDFDRRSLQSLQKGYYGASIMPVAIIEELAARLPAMRLFNFYGQTELAPVATILKPEDQQRKLGSAGRPGLNVETRIVDDTCQPLPAGAQGEIVHRSPQATLGYFNNPEKTAEAFRSGWFHSGDLGYMDAEGYLYVVDRKKDMIKSGGENVASREVEEILFKHPAIAEVAVIGIPHPHWIETVIAAVVLKADESLEEELLIAWARERLAPYKTPKRVFVVDELPKNASGKIMKRELRARFTTE